MNQDFTVKKKRIFVRKKNSHRGVHQQKKSCKSSERKKNSCKLKIPHPPTPITFLMVRPFLGFIRCPVTYKDSQVQGYRNPTIT